MMIPFSCFRPEILSLDKFGPKSQNCRFNLKFGTFLNSNIDNLTVIFTFLFSTLNILFG